MIIAQEIAIAAFTTIDITLITVSSISCAFRFRGSGRFVGISAVLSLSSSCPSQAGGGRRGSSDIRTVDRQQTSHKIATGDIALRGNAGAHVGECHREGHLGDMQPKTYDRTDSAIGPNPVPAVVVPGISEVPTKTRLIRACTLLRSEID